MSGTRTCLACGHEGHDVRMRVVAYDDPRPVTVHIPVSHREDAIEEQREVPGRFGSETRCLDEAACKERELLLNAPEVAPVEPTAAVEPGPEAWL